MAFSTRCMRDEDWKLCPHFPRAEFKHPDRMGYEWMLKLEEIRRKADVAMSVSSSYRTKQYNQLVGGAEDSSHVDEICDATDFKKQPTEDDPNWNRARFRIVAAAIECGIRRIGIYPNGSIHLDGTHDTRPAPRLWIAVDNPAKK